METTSRHIVVLGPESTGKSTLAEKLSIELGIPLFPEFAREYLESHGAHYTKADLDRIAAGQAQRMQQMLQLPMIFDTDLLNIYIWKKEKFQIDDQNILDYWKKKAAGLYLLMKPDVEWVFDPLRESKDVREELFQEHIELLDEAAFNYHIISGDYPERHAQAQEICREFLGT